MRGFRRTPEGGAYLAILSPHVTSMDFRWRMRMGLVAIAGRVGEHLIEEVPLGFWDTPDGDPARSEMDQAIFTDVLGCAPYHEQMPLHLWSDRLQAAALLWLAPYKAHVTAVSERLLSVWGYDQAPLEAALEHPGGIVPGGLLPAFEALLAAIGHGGALERKALGA
ncbi:MAG: hypothetical protein ACREF4_08655 [Gammaproteobacteria bacterium]